MAAPLVGTVCFCGLEPTHMLMSDSGRICGTQQAGYFMQTAAPALRRACHQHVYPTLAVSLMLCFICAF